jgi:hypothetical protein
MDYLKTKVERRNKCILFGFNLFSGSILNPRAEPQDIGGQHIRKAQI